MRTIFVLPAFLLVACAAEATEPVTYDSLRDRLAEPTRLELPAASNVGELAARRWSSTGWVDGTATVSLAGGALVAKLDSAGHLVASELQLAVDPIELPATIIGTPLTLRDVRVGLETSSPPADITWTGNDEAACTLDLELVLSWSIEHDGQLFPLGEQKLPPIAAHLTLVGDGATVDASLALHGEGTLWSWAELLELTKLDLVIRGATIN